YLMEAGEALDLIGAKHGLQHLDVKPANLFLTGGHVQVGDYGLVSKLDGRKNGRGSRGLTPRYAAPEVLQGQVHTRSDQYSLALVYQELLSGTFPFPGRTPQQIMIQHVSAVPDLTGLPERDRSAVGRALAKKPEERFPSCMAFIRALTAASASTANAPRLALITPSKKQNQSPGHQTVRPVSDPTLVPNPQTQGPGDSNQPTSQNIPSSTPLPGSSGERLRFAGVGGLPGQSNFGVLTPAPVFSPHEQLHSPFAPKLNQILSIFPVDHLLGRSTSAPRRTPAQFVGAVMQTAETREGASELGGVVIRLPDGTWSCRFLSSIDPRVAQVKLDLLWEEGGVTMDARNVGRVVFRRPLMAPVKAGLFGGTSMKDTNSGLEVVVQLPEPGRGASEILATGNLYGAPPADFAHTAERVIVKLLDGVRRELNNIEERRKHPRIPVAFQASLFPLHPDGGIDPPIAARCKDVSRGGLAILAPSKPPTRHMYVAFDDVPGTAGLAVLVQIIRTERRDDEVLVTGRFRLDFGPEHLDD
ncbi:MAG TPA: PilZ domain-containing protein, partial [Gemmata sp.]|nr:PilZ domain-containing protein [Gemmata sp.]